MIVYFADRFLNIIDKASSDLPEGFRIFDDAKTEEIDSASATLSFTLKYDESAQEQAREMAYVGNYILRQYNDQGECYTIIDSEEDTAKNTIYIYAEDAGLDLLNDVYGAYTADGPKTIQFYVERFSKDSGFEIHINELPNNTRTLSWDTDSTAAERILSIAASFSAELGFSFEIEGLTLTHRYINIYKQRGKNSGVELRMNREINRIVVKRSIANLATGYKVIGGTPEGESDPITLNGYTYDDGNFYVAGSYLFCREANKIWSRRYAEEGVNAGYICKIFTGTSTNQKALCSQAIASLKKASQIEENYEIDLATVPEGLEIGDTVYVIDNSGGIYLESRVLKLEIREGEKYFAVTLGDYLIKSDNYVVESAEVDESTTSISQMGEGSGWLYASLDPSFLADINNPVQYRKKDGRVEIRGVISPSSELPAGSASIFTLPSGYRPTRNVLVTEEGTGMNRWTLGISVEGEVTFSNYGSSENIPCPVAEKLSFDYSFFLD